MRRLTHREFLEARDRYDAAVAAAPGATPFVSGSLWQLAARDTLERPGADDETLIVEDGGDWLLFAERGGQRLFAPYETAWLFGCPLVGNAETLPDLLHEAARRYLASPAAFLVGGVPRGGPLEAALQGSRHRYRQSGTFPGTDCMLIDLEGDAEAWLGRRSPRFRKGLAKLRLPEGHRFEEADRLSPGALLQRLLAVQARTYKWREGSDIFLDPRYRAFYERLIAGLHRRGGVRATFVTGEGGDLAYILGGVEGGTYRGLQMGYDESRREAGLGNLLQWQNLQDRATEGLRRYDLGMHSPYKERWADRWERFGGFFLVA